MIDLSQIQSRYNPNALPSSNAMTSQQARVEAQNLLQNGLSQSVITTLDLLMTAGVLPAHRLPSAQRTLRDYQRQRLLDRLPYTTPEMQDAFDAHGLPYPEDARLVIYTLGPVGAEIVRLRHEVQPPGGYLAYPLERVMHDLVMNEIILTIANQAMQHGWAPVWVSKYEATLYTPDRKTALLEPDGMLRIKRDDEERVYLFEYHNEDKATRARKKANRYQAACDQKDLWMDQWEVETFPPLLAVFRRPVVGRGYAERLAEGGIRVQVYGRTLESALAEGFSSWYHFNQGERVNLFPWHLEASDDTPQEQED